jgi:LCP family protein required for cell wall assembly
MVKSRKIIFLSALTSAIVLFIMGFSMLFFIRIPISQKNIKIPGGNVISSVLNLSDYRESEKNPFNMLLLGGDVSNSLTDTMMVVNYNPKYDKLSFLSIPRDTKVNYNGANVKINSIYSRSGKNNKGLEDVQSNVEELLKINIDYYLFIDTSAFRKIIDILGEIEYEVKVPMHYDDPTQNLHIHFEPGKYFFDGQKAEEFMRFRKPNYGNYSNSLMKYYDGSDLKRIDAQQDFIKELIKQKSNLKSISKFKDLVEVIFDNINTNLELQTVLDFSTNVLSFKTENISFFKINGYDDIQYGEWFYVYNYEIIDNSSDELYSCDDILKIHFADSNYKLDNYDYIKNHSTPPIEETITNSPTIFPTDKPIIYEPQQNNPSNNKTYLENMDNLY